MMACVVIGKLLGNCAFQHRRGALEYHTSIPVGEGSDWMDQASRR